MPVYTFSCDVTDDDGDEATAHLIVEGKDVKEATEILCSEGEIDVESITEISWLAIGVVRRGSNRKKGS
jgi:hypothetical protein